MNVIKQLAMVAAACSMAGLAGAQVTSITANTPYNIRNVTSGLVLNNGGSTANGSPVTQWNLVTSQNLQWEFVSPTNGYYQIRSVQSGLDCVVQNASTSNNWPRRRPKATRRRPRPRSCRSTRRA